MKRAAPIALAAIVLVVAGLLLRRPREGASCGEGFAAEGARCLPACPSCARKNARVLVPAAHLVIGASDWEAEGKVKPREVDVRAFFIDALEVAAGELDPRERDPLRAASGVTREEARAFCAARGGRLPTDDEWTSATGARRYPWGDTGAVCRRAAWGLVTGPCATRADATADTVGAHADGATASGIFDLSGNVAEWVDAKEAEKTRAFVRGGSYQSSLAADLRTWAREELDPNARLPWVGFRCAYDEP